MLCCGNSMRGLMLRQDHHGLFPLHLITVYTLQVREWAAAVVPGIESVGIDRVSLTRYPYPGDGHPMIGFAEKVSNVYIAVMHSGATLGPLVGQLAAAEITGTASEEELALLKPYRLERDWSTTQQAYTVGGAQKV